MQRPYRVAWLLPALTFALVSSLTADDRNLLKDVSAPPNILIVLDSSGSMIGTAENGPARGGGDVILPPFAMQIGAGDDPRSRMGIAKRVLEDFLRTATNVNFAFAQYSQTLPVGQTPIFQEHWVYEALGSDRFRMVEPGYAYRVGINKDYLLRVLRDPAEFATDVLVGQQVQYSDSSSPETRYGPISPGTLLGNADYYDEMPIYFGDSPSYVFPAGGDPWSYGTWKTRRRETDPALPKLHSRRLHRLPGDLGGPSRQRSDPSVAAPRPPRDSGRQHASGDRCQRRPDRQYPGCRPPRGD